MKNLVLKIILGIVYIIVYPLKIKKSKITFISYKTNKLNRDFKMISDELQKRGHEDLHYVLIKFEKNLIGNLNYLLNCIIQTYHINTSRVVILDSNNFVVSNYKKKDVKVIQVWHASGAIKRFGNHLDREYEVKNYDYVLCTSEQWIKPYSEAFNVNEENVLPIGIPVTDRLFSDETMATYREKMLTKYPQVLNKKVVLYAPTFRGNHLQNTRFQPIDLEYIQKSLGDDYIVIYKLHPWLEDSFLCENSAIIRANKESISQLFSITDYLITDYSAILFDFAILNKPIISFVPDLEEYKREVGMYVDYENEIPAPICKTEEEVVHTILKDQFDYNKIEIFKERYFKYCDGISTQRVVDLIESILQI